MSKPTAGSSKEHLRDLPAWLPGDRGQRPTNGRRQQVQGEDTFRRLLDAARYVFGQQGFAATRVDDVVALAGTSHGTFYLYFRNKQDLLHYLAIECGVELTRLTTRLQELPASPTDDELTPWVRDFVVAYRKYAPVFAVWLEGRELDPLMQALADDRLGSLADAVHQRLDPAISDAVGDPLATLGVLSLLDRMSSYSEASEGALDDDRAVAATTALLRVAFARRG